MKSGSRLHAQGRSIPVLGSCAAVIVLLILAACDTRTSIALSGAETAGVNDVPRPVPARATRQRDGTVYLELVAADGAVFRGPLSFVALPVVPSTVARAPVAGGGSGLAGSVANEAGESLDCRLDLTYAQRGVDGGGIGACTGGSRRVDFIF